MAKPRAIAEAIEEHVKLPGGKAERFAGYAVMALPFQSGHVLALRRFPSTSIGPGYVSIWHRTPEGSWTIYADAPPIRSCSRYFSNATDRHVETPIELAWDDERTLRVRAGGDVGLDWKLSIASTPMTRVLNAMSSLIPGPLLRQRWLLAAMGRVVGPILGAGRIRLHGRVPNGQAFVANPRRMWTVADARASLGGCDFGPIGPLPEQAHLADFWMPQRGVFTVADVFLEPYDAQRHVLPAEKSWDGEPVLA